MGLLVSAALMVAQAGGTAALPLPPVTPWNLEYAPNACTASRGFGVPTKPIMVGFETIPFGKAVKVMLLGPTKQLGNKPTTDVTIAAAGRVLDGKFDGLRTIFDKTDTTVLVYYIPRKIFESLVNAPSFTVRPSDGPPVSVALSLAKEMIPTLGKCEAGLIKQYGFDLAKAEAVATPAEGDVPGTWVNWDDYPTSAQRNREQGTVLAGWTITSEGRISECRILSSSGSAALDKASCDAVMRRGRYHRPGLDAAGKPVESYAISKFMWMLPG